MQLTHGIVTDTHVAYFAIVQGCLQWLQQPIDAAALTSIGAYVDVANKHQLAQLWVLPGTGISEAFSGYDDNFVTSSLQQYRVFPRELDSYLVARHVNRPGKEVTLVVPAYIRGLPQSVTHMPDAKALYAYVTYLQALLGVSFTRDAKGTGIELLYTVNNTPERKGITACTGYLRPVEADLTPFYSHKQRDITWSRALLPEETHLQYLHAIDRNTMYLAATSGLHVGRGNYLHAVVSPGQVTSKLTAVHSISFDKKQPGLWLVSLAGTTPFDTGLLPPLFASGTWQDTAMVQAAIESGYQVTVHESYYFPEVHTMFNPWYIVLRDAINALVTDSTRFKNDTARTAALETVKMLYKQAIGLMGRTPEADEKLKWYNRPDAYNAVIAESKRRMFVTIRELLAANIHIVGVNLDEILFVSNQPLDQVLPDKVVISDQIGKYKHKATYPLADVAHMLTSNPHTFIQGLARYRKEVA